MKKIGNNDYIMTALKKIIMIFCGLINLIILNRYLGPILRGEYNYILNTVNIIITALNLGITFSYAYYKRKDIEKKDILNHFVALILFQLIINTLILAIIVNVLNEKLFQLMFMLIPISVFRMQLNYISMVENLKKQNITSIYINVINTVLLFVIYIFFPSKLLYAIYVYLLKEIISSFLFYKILNIKLKRENINFKIWLKILKFGIVPTFTALMIAFNYKLDVIIIKSLGIDFYWIGLYTTGVSLAEYAWIIPDIFKEVMINKTAKEDSIESLNCSLRITSTILIIIYLIILLFGKKIIILLFGEDYSSAYSVTRIIFLGIFSMTYCKILGTLYIAKGQWKLYSFTLSGSVLLNILLNYILIPKLHIVGAAIATVLSYTLAGVVFLIDFKIKYRLKYKSFLFLNKNDLYKIKMIMKERGK